MKKILFLVSALFISLMISASEINLMDRLPFNYFDTGVEQGATPESILFKSQYKGGGFDMQGEDLISQGGDIVVVYFTTNRGSEDVGQITLNVTYFDAAGEVYDTPVDCRTISSLKAGKAILPLLYREGWTIDKIYVAAGWCDPNEPTEQVPASAENPLEITITGWVVKYVPCSFECLPQGPIITFDDGFFCSGYEFASQCFYPMPAWGWASAAGEITVVEKEIGNNALKIQPKDNGLAAIFEKVKLPAGDTVEDIHTIQFDVFWEKYETTVEGEKVELQVGDDVTSTEVMLYIGTGPKLGEGVNFGTENNISFKGNPTPLVGVMGEWFTYSVTLADFFNTSLNNPGGADKDFDMKGANVALALNEFRFGIGLNANNGIYYLDNIKFLKDPCCMPCCEEEDPFNSVEKVSAVSVKVYSIPGGLSI